uniref:CSON002225 protein n=1 Tax=Culicoides sonorensis TaxID=179676 RepID=A0A336MWC5_CULSO
MSFDVHNSESYYLENVNRDEAEVLLADNEIGTFLVRKSSDQIHLALSIKEPSKIGHYQIVRNNVNGRCEFKIGEQSFPALPELLTFYKLHYVGEAPLIRPIYWNRGEENGTREEEQSSVPRLARVIMSRVPNAYDPNELELRRGEIIEVIRQNVNGKWEGRRLSTGTVGLFPFNHVIFIEDEDEDTA